jgi:hypothetical protein
MALSKPQEKVAMHTLRVQVVSSRVVEGVSATTKRPYRFVECECNVQLGSDVRTAKFNLPRNQDTDVLKPGVYEVEVGSYVNNKGQLAAGINKVRAVSAVKAVA